MKVDYCYECKCYENCAAAFELIGDGYCDDETNTLNCNFDGGDCCTVCVNTDYCLDCICHQDDIADVQTGENNLESFLTNQNSYQCPVDCGVSILGVQN